MVTRRTALPGVLGLVMSLCLAVQVAATDVDMADVRRLAREPVETILSGAPFGRVSDADYWKTVRGSPKPVVVVFYANQDERSRTLATLARSLALEFSEAVGFYGYRVSAGAAVEQNALAALGKRYGSRRSRPHFSMTTIAGRWSSRGPITRSRPCSSIGRPASSSVQ